MMEFQIPINIFDNINMDVRKRILTRDISAKKRKILLSDLGVKTLKDALKRYGISDFFGTSVAYDELRKINNASIMKYRRLKKKDESSINQSLAEYNKNPKAGFTFKNMNKTKLKKLLESMEHDPKNKNLLQIGKKTYTLNVNTIGKMLNNLEDVWLETDESDKSDWEIIQQIRDITEMTLKQIPYPENINHYNMNKGQFFKYYNLSGVDLTAFQIYSNDDPENDNEHCFIYSLRKAGVDSVTINSIKADMKCIALPQRVLRQIAEEYDLYIAVKRTNNPNLSYYPKKATQKATQKVISLGLIDDHYFNITKLPITKICLENLDNQDFKKKWKADWTRIISIRGDKAKPFPNDTSYKSSYDVIKYLSENSDKYFKLIPMATLYKSIEYKDSRNQQKITNLGYSQNDTREKNNKFQDENGEPIGLYPTLQDEQIVKNIAYTNLFFDFESTTVGQHVAYCCVLEDQKFESTTEKDCARLMLDYVYNHYHGEGKGVMLIAHNVRYDVSFIFKYLSNVNFIERGTKILRGTAWYYPSKGKHIKLIIQDSSSHIATKLSEFGEMFNLDVKKEIMPYNIYTKETIEKRCLPLVEWRNAIHREWTCKNIGKKFSQTEAKALFTESLENATKWDCINEKGEIDIVKYSLEYCIMDVKVLKAGYNKFREWIFAITGLDINDYVSIASLADSYMVKEGCFTGVYELARIPRVFIYKCCDGGRTMTRDNQKWHVKRLLDDFDAVSLYPSAMGRMKGYLLGVPKIIQKWDPDNKWDGYFVEIVITKVGKHRHFPLMNYTDPKNGTKNWTNDMVGRTMWCDKTKLEDIVKYQDVKYDFVRGYYYNEGHNPKVKEVISKLFKERLKQKALKNPIQKIYKLLMNASYGKTMMKPIETEVKYVKVNEIGIFLDKYFDFISEGYELLPNEQYYRIKVIKPINTHYNTCHVGCEILSMSKRIMNEVICLAEDLNQPIYYQDTDSMHIESQCVGPLAEEYEKKYGRSLIGKEMGQFHSDFDSEIIKTGVVSKESYFLGKKAYIDHLVGEDADGKPAEDFHTRMKGVNNPAILDETLMNHTNPMDVYAKLGNDDPVTFDLGCRGKKVNFQMNKDMSCETKVVFNRTVSFKGELNVVEPY